MVRRTVAQRLDTHEASEPRQQGLDRDEIGERLYAVDLDHGNELAVGGLQGVVAADIDQLEVERGVGPSLTDDLDRPVAEVAALGVEERDGGQRRYG